MRRHLLLLALAALTSASAFAQQHPNQARGFAADRVYQGLGGIDTVNTFNGNLSLTIGFPSFPAGGPLSYTVGPLTYNSNVWEFEPVIRNGQEKTFAYPVNSSNAGLGWTFGLGRLLSPTEAGSAYWVYLTPDGAERSFRNTLHGETPVAGVWYTHDSSYLRLRELNPGSPTTQRELDFPDGTIHRFDAAGKLVSIRDRFGNEVTVTQTDTTWTIEDAWRTQTIEFELMNYDGVQKSMLTKVTLTAFGSGATAEWTFRYAQGESVNRSCGDTDIDSSAAVIVPLLIGIDLPDGSSYEMPAEYYNRTVACSAEVSPRGMLSRLRLPTLGRIEWSYGRYQMSDERVRDMAIGVTQRKLVSATGSTLGTWLYASQRGENMNPTLPPAADPVYGYKTTTVTQPDGSHTKHYFLVFGFSPSPGYPGWTIDEYGLPFTHTEDDGDTSPRLFSSETISASGVVLRSRYVRYESDTFGVNRRVASEKTVFHDDGDRFTTVDRSQFDGFGHYRQSSSGGDFPDTLTRTSFTNYNTVFPAAADPWLLGLYDRTDITENGRTERVLYCFDAANGFLKFRRTLNGTSAGAHDLLARFVRWDDGSLRSEQYRGGDTQEIPVTALCSINAPTHQYRIDHTYSFGTLATSTYYKPDGNAMPFPIYDATIDANTGLASSSRDSAGHETAFEYDASGRLTRVTPPGVEFTTYIYTNAALDGTAYTPATATVRKESASPALGTIESQLRFDSLGRPWRTRTLLPDGNWGVTETLYNLQGQRASVSQRQVLTVPSGSSEDAVAPAHKTTFSYDAFGRPLAVNAPDGTSTVWTYTGARVVRRQQTIGSTPVATDEERDGHGRLIAVTENASDPAGSVRTSYKYDVGGWLVEVTIPDGNGAEQKRFFTYDLRGLLTSEQHPELGSGGNGSKSYSGYDARGHATRVITGAASGPFDLTMTLDAAERVTKIARTSGAQTISTFAYDDPSGAASAWCGSGACKGKIATASRFNDDPDLGNVEVKDRYQYDGPGGRLSRRETEVLGTASFAGETFSLSQTWNDLGDVEALTYPCRMSGGVCTGDHTAPVVQHQYANGALTGIQGWAVFGYHANGALATIARGSGASQLVETWAADPHGIPRTRSIAAGKPGQPALWTSGDYGYDGSGNVTSVGTKSYQYDSFGRLSGWTETGADGAYHSTTRAYDTFGNHLFSTVRGCGPSTQQPRPCLSTSFVPFELDGTTNHYEHMTYDDAGNVVSDGRTFAYDPVGMTKKAVINERDYRYLYSADDERIATVERLNVAGIIRNHTTWTARGFGGEVLSVWDDDATSGARVITWQSDEIFRGGMLLGEITPAGRRHFSIDHLGSPRVLTDDAGNLIGRQDFDAFGGGGASDGGPLQFTGHERDAALYGEGDSMIPDNLHARYYSAGTGRFLSVDPVVSEWTLYLPQGWNRYSYALNNPMRFTDPTGREVKCVPGEKEGDPPICGEELDVEGEEPKVEPQPLPPMAFAGMLPVETQQLRMRERDQREFVRNQQEQQRVSNCFDNHRFSSVIGDLTGSETAQSVTGFLEVGSEISLGGDLVATAYKATRVSLGNQPYASGMNAAFRGFGRAIGKPAWGRAVTKFGDKATPALAVFGAFTAAYNATTYIQCRAGLL